MAASVDPATERIVRFLNEGFGVPVNVVFFRHFEDRGGSYLARTWLVDQEAQDVSAASTRARKSREPWNWYVSFGESPNGRSWDDTARHGFVSAGGGEWFSRTLRGLPVGARVFACIPKHGYVGVGIVAGEAAPFDRAEVRVNSAPTCLTDLPLQGTYWHREDGDTAESAEYVVPIDRQSTRSRMHAFWKVCSPTKTALAAYVVNSPSNSWLDSLASRTKLLMDC